MHRHLAQHRHRSNREFFDCSLDIAVEALRKNALGLKVLDERYGDVVSYSEEWEKKNETKIQINNRKENERKFYRQENEARRIAEIQLRNDHKKKLANEEENRRDTWSKRVEGKTQSEAHPKKYGVWDLLGLIVMFPLIPFMIIEWLMSLGCLLYTSPSPRDRQKSRMPSSA